MRKREQNVRGNNCNRALAWPGVCSAAGRASTLCLGPARDQVAAESGVSRLLVTPSVAA